MLKDVYVRRGEMLLLQRPHLNWQLVGGGGGLPLPFIPNQGGGHILKKKSPPVRKGIAEIQMNFHSFKEKITYTL